MFQAKVAMDAGVGLGAPSPAGANGGGPVPTRTTAAPQMANPALAADTSTGVQAHEMLWLLVALEVLVLLYGRHFFRHHHGG